MTDDSTSNPTRPKTRAPLLPPPAPIPYRMIGRLYNEAYCANTVNVNAAGGQRRVEAEDNVEAHSWRYWHRYIINGIVGIAVPVSSFRRFRFSFSLGYGPSIHQLYCAAHILLVMEMGRTSFFPAPWSRPCPIFVSIRLHLPFPRSCSRFYSFLFLVLLLHYNN